MSYGYLIASSSPVRFIEKSRRFKFSLLDSSDEFYFDSRLEESNELTIRNNQKQKSMVTDAGLTYLGNIPPPFFFVDYLLTRNQSESNLIATIKKSIKMKKFEILCLSKPRELRLDQLYKVMP